MKYIATLLLLAGSALGQTIAGTSGSNVVTICKVEGDMDCAVVIGYTKSPKERIAELEAENARLREIAKQSTDIALKAIVLNGEYEVRLAEIRVRLREMQKTLQSTQVKH